MANLRVQEAVDLQRALSLPEVQIAIRHFFHEQARDAAEKLVTEMRKDEPSKLRAAQHAGRLDAWETAWNELQHFVDRQLKVAE